MNKSTLPIILAVGGIGYLYVNQKIDVANRLDYRFGGISNVSLKNGALSFTQIIAILNPTPNTLTVNSLDLDVSFNKNKIGNTYFINKVAIKAGTETSLGCRCVIPFTKIAPIWDSIKSNGFTVNMKGTINAIGVTIPVNEDIKITIPNF